VDHFHRSDRGPVVALVLLCLVLFGLTLGAHDFWEPDEPEYALVARTMAERGDWVVPWQGGEWFADKPPLLFWSVLATTGGGAAFEGDAAWAPLLARLPSAMAALLLVLSLYFFAAPVCGRRAAFLSGVVLATTVGFAQKARWLQPDLLFAAFVGMALMAFLAADRAPRSRPSGKGLIAGWLCLGLAWLAKGPLAVVLVALAMAGHLRLRPEGSTKRWFATPAHAAGAVLFLALVVPWYGLLWSRLGPEEAKAFLGHHFLFENVGRVVSATTHRQPPWYYLTRLPVEFLPWTGVLVAALVWGVRQARRGFSLERTALAWAALMVLALSLVSSKQGKYLLPAYAPLALLCGAWLDGPAFRNPMARRTRVAVGFGAGVLVLAGATAALAAFVPHPRLEEVPGLALALVPGGLLLALGGAVALTRLLLLADARRSAMDVGAALALGGAALLLGVMPRLDPGKSARLFCEDALAVMPADGEVAQFGAWRSAYPYFLRRDTANLRFPRTYGDRDREGRRKAVGQAREATHRFLDRPGRGFLVTREGYWRRDMDADLKARLEEEPLVRRDIGGKTIVLLGER
jgi:4-amino-4-deoxy-L-arabinose transferase-like glycosyltransferase